MNCVRVDPPIEPQVFKLGAEARQPLGLLRLRTEFVQIKEFPERLIAGAPRRLVEYVGIVGRRGELHIDAGSSPSAASSISWQSGC